MQRIICASTAIVLWMLPATIEAQGQRDAATGELARIQEATGVLRELVEAPDAGIPAYLLERAQAVIVVPNLVKGGFVVGAEHGRGIISVRRPTGGWSTPGFVNMTGGSIGWQIGVQSVDLVLLVMNRQGVDDLLQDRFTLGGSASVSAGPVGRSARAQTDAQISSQILAHSRSRGLFAGATFSGAALHADHDANRLLYGPDATLTSVLDGRASVAPAAETVIGRWTHMLRGVSAAPGAARLQQPGE